MVYIDRLELILARSEARGEYVDSDEVAEYLTTGWDDPYQSCLYCGGPALEQDRILKRRVARLLGKPVRMIVALYACDDCLADLGYAKGESIGARREFLIRKYEEQAYERKLKDKKVKKEVERAQKARDQERAKRGQKPVNKGKLKRGRDLREPFRR